MMKQRTAATMIVALAAAAVIVYGLSKRADKPSESTGGVPGSAVNIPAPEPTMTTERVPQARQKGFQPPPSDVAGISNPKAEAKP